MRRRRCYCLSTGSEGAVVREEGRPDIDGEEFAKVFDRRSLDGRCFRDPCIRDKDVEAIAHDGADLLGEPVWTVRCGEISFAAGATHWLTTIRRPVDGRSSAIDGVACGFGRRLRSCAATIGPN
jgi:hypothetical protein